MRNSGMGKYQAYVWKGHNKWRQKVNGIIIAENDFNAENQAQQLGVTITYFRQRHVLLLPRQAAKNIKIADIVFSMRQLATLISASVPLVQALEIMSEGIEKARLRALLLIIRDDVAAGQTFSQALTMHPRYFSPMICGLVAAGEQAGTLDQIMNEIATFLERHEQLKHAIKKALYYPGAVLSIALLIMLGMLIFLVPQFQAIYTSFGAKLPAFTQLVVDFSYLIRHYWWLLLLGLGILIVGIMQLSRRSENFRRVRDYSVLKIFLFGELARKAIISRICLTLAITLAAGVPLMNALERLIQVAGNILFRDAIAQTREEVAQGESMAKSMKETFLFPSLVVQMVNIGEKSGALESMLRKISDYYREQVNTMVDGLTTLIEPILLILIAAIIGSFVVAMYLPIFNLGMAIK